MQLTKAEVKDCRKDPLGFQSPQAHLASAASKQTPGIHKTTLKAALLVSPFHSLLKKQNKKTPKTVKLLGLFSALGIEESNLDTHSPACRWANSPRMANWKTFSPRNSLIPEPLKYFSASAEYSVQPNYPGSFKALALIFVCLLVFFSQHFLFLLKMF